MKSSIVPMSSVPAPLVQAYLREQGMSDDIIAWKYFDDAFNRGRERGYVWFKERVRGFIGIIPVTLATPEGDREAIWTCDWSVEEWNRNPGIGVRLLRKVYDQHGFAAAVGGSDYTQAILPRMETRTVTGAALFLHLPLRAGALLEKLEERFAWLPKLSRAWPGRISLPSRFQGSPGGTAKFAPGISASLGQLFDQPTADFCRFRHDRTFLEWQMTRCPGIRAVSCIADAGGRPAAGALLWTSAEKPGHWRAVFRYAPPDVATLQSVLAMAAEWLRKERALLLSTIVSHVDEPVIDLLRGNGFVQGSRRWPLYVRNAHDPDSCSKGMAGLSFLDADLASRF